MLGLLDMVFTKKATVGEVTKGLQRRPTLDFDSFADKKSNIFRLLSVGRHQVGEWRWTLKIHNTDDVKIALLCWIALFSVQFQQRDGKCLAWRLYLPSLWTIPRF